MSVFQPTFGIDDMVSPPAREPVALVNVSQQSNRTQSHLQESSSSSSFSSNHRPNGEGGDSKGLVALINTYVSSTATAL